MKSRCIILFLLSSIAICTANEEGFNRYQTILDRQPFGQEPIDNDAPQVVPAAQSFARNLRLSMLFEGPDGSLRVGIVDNTNKKSYILGVGEEPQDGMELVEANIETAEAMLRKGNEVALFKLESGGSEPVSKSEQSSRLSSYAERRRALLKKIETRRSQQEAQKPPEPQLSGEALKKHLEEVQMNAIRNGQPPLPIPLTREMDDQLVKEGVLPPQ